MPGDAESPGIQDPLYLALGLGDAYQESGEATRKSSPWARIENKSLRHRCKSHASHQMFDVRVSAKQRKGSPHCALVPTLAAHARKKRSVRYITAAGSQRPPRRRTSLLFPLRLKGWQEIMMRLLPISAAPAAPAAPAAAAAATAAEATETAATAAAAASAASPSSSHSSTTWTREGPRTDSSFTDRYTCVNSN